MSKRHGVYIVGLRVERTRCVYFWGACQNDTIFNVSMRDEKTQCLFLVCVSKRHGVYIVGLRVDPANKSKGSCWGAE